MKTLLVLLLVAGCVDAASNKKSAQSAPQAASAEKKAVSQQQPKNEVLNAIDKKEEDCDDKAKKPVEIIPEEVSLSGNTGCTLEE